MVGCVSVVVDDVFLQTPSQETEHISKHTRAQESLVDADIEKLGGPIGNLP